MNAFKKMMKINIDSLQDLFCVLIHRTISHIFTLIQFWIIQEYGLIYCGSFKRLNIKIYYSFPPNFEC